MAHEKGTAPRVESTGWWSSRRVKWVGFVALLWNFAFATLVYTYYAMGLDPTPGAYSGLQAATLWVPHIVAYLTTLAVLLAVDARYAFGRVSSAFLYAYCGMYAVLSLGIVYELLLPVLPRWEPALSAVGALFLAVHVLAPVAGIVLWRSPDDRGLAAVLFVSILPIAVVMVAIAVIADVTPPVGAIEMPLALGAAVLGYQLWEHPAGPTPSGSAGP